jgi:hypothetical protein
MKNKIKQPILSNENKSKLKIANFFIIDDLSKKELTKITIEQHSQLEKAREDLVRLVGCWA